MRSFSWNSLLLLVLTLPAGFCGGAQKEEKEKAGSPEAMFDTAVSLVGQIKSPRTKGMAMTDVAQEMVKAGKTEKASSLVDKALELARSMADTQSKDEVLFEIVDAYVGAGKTHKALEVAGTMHDSYWKAKKLADVAAACSEAEECKQIYATVKTLEDGYWKIYAAMDVVRCFKRSGKNAVAGSALDEMTSLAQQTKDP